MHRQKGWLLFLCMIVFQKTGLCIKTGNRTPTQMTSTCTTTTVQVLLIIHLHSSHCNLKFIAITRHSGHNEQLELCPRTVVSNDYVIKSL